MRAYLGIVSSRGLEWLLPESDHVLRFLAGQAYAHLPVTGICCWAAMQARTAMQIQGELEGGDADAALRYGYYMHRPRFLVPSFRPTSPKRPGLISFLQRPEARPHFSSFKHVTMFSQRAMDLIGPKLSLVFPPVPSSSLIYAVARYCPGRLAGSRERTVVQTYRLT